MNTGTGFRTMNLRSLFFLLHGPAPMIVFLAKRVFQRSDTGKIVLAHDPIYNDVQALAERPYMGKIIYFSWFSAKIK